MSRGPGIWQRAILERIEAGKVVILTGPDQTHSDQNAIRRAANTLEAAGRLRITALLIDGRSRLVACPLAMSAPGPHLVTGLDGKVYRVPATRSPAEGSAQVRGLRLSS